MLLDWKQDGKFPTFETMQPCKTSLQTFIYKHMVDLEIVQRNRKKEKCQRSIAHNRSAISLHIKN
jgi:hypothetical protein